MRAQRLAPNIPATMTARAMPFRAVPVPAHATRNRVPLQHEAAHHDALDALIVRLFCAWMFLQCFFYQALPSLRLNVGVSLTPDRLVLMAMLLAFAVRLAISRSSPKPTATAAALGRVIVLFGLINLTSWWISGADANRPTFANLTQLFNLAFFPALSYFVARRLGTRKSMLRQLLGFFAALGVYLSVTSIAEHFQINALVFPKYILDPQSASTLVAAEDHSWIPSATAEC